MNKKGFTLIELLVVIAIIGLLASIVLSSLSSSRAKAVDTRRVQSLKEVQKAMELKAADNSGEFADTGGWKSYESSATALVPSLKTDKAYAAGIPPKGNDAYLNPHIKSIGKMIDPGGLLLIKADKQNYKLVMFGFSDINNIPPSLRLSSNEVGGECPPNAPVASIISSETIKTDSNWFVACEGLIDEK